MVTTDWILFRAAANVADPEVSGALAWADVNNALNGSDDDYAVLSTPSDSIVTPSDYLRFLDPDTSTMPVDVVIVGMRYRLRVAGIDDSFGDEPYSAMRAVVGGEITGDNLHYPLLFGGIGNGDYESELRPSRAEIDANFGCVRRVQSNNVGGEYRVYSAWVQFDYEPPPSYASLPGMSESAQGKSIGTANATLPGLTAKAAYWPK